MSRKRGNYQLFRDSMRLLQHQDKDPDVLIERANKLAKILGGVYKVKDQYGEIVYSTEVDNCEPKG